MQTTVQDAFALAARHEAGGRSAEARAIYEQILAAMPEHPGALLRIAEQELVAAAKSTPRMRSSPALCWPRATRRCRRTRSGWQRARAHLARDERDEAVAAVEQAMARLPQNAAIALKLGALARDAGGLDVAERCFRVAREHDAARLHALGKAQKAAGALDAARTTLERCAALAPDDAGILNTLGATCLELDDAAQARRHFGRAIESGRWSAASCGTTWGLPAARWVTRKVRWRHSSARLQVAPRLTTAMANLVYAQQYLCAWDALEQSERRLAATLTDPAADPRWPPFVALAMPLTPAQQLEVARRWSRAMLPAPAARRRPPPRAKRLRVRLPVRQLSRTSDRTPDGRPFRGA